MCLKRTDLINSSEMKKQKRTQDRYRNRLMINDDLLLGPGPASLAGLVSTESSRHGHSVAYITHSDSGINGDLNTFVLSSKRLEEADAYLLRANKSVHRRWPIGKHELDNDIRSASYLVRWCQTLYTVGLFTDDASLLKISGELAWPCQVYIDRFLYDQEPMDLCNLYMFDLKGETWFRWRSRWSRVSSVPPPSGIYSVLGIDRLTKASRQAMEELWMPDSTYDDT